MPTLYIHIGTPKTGTTAIQRFCKTNQELLFKKGYCYPDSQYVYPNVGRLRNGHFLSGGYKKEDGSRDVERDKQVLDDAMNQIIGLLSKYENVILSDEGIWHSTRKYRANIWDYLNKKSEEYNFQIKIIVYLRRQDTFASSWLNQSIKEGLNSPFSIMEWEDFVNRKPFHLITDYYGHISKIAKVLGKENIIVRVFEKKSFVGDGNTIISDFLDAIGLKLTDDFIIDYTIPNQSITANIQEIKRILNILANRDPTKLALFRGSVDACANLSNPPHSYSMFSQKEQAEFLSQYAEGNKKIAKEYLGKNGELFEPPTSHHIKWSKDNPYMIDDVICFFGDIALKQQQKIDDLTKEVKYLRYIINCLKHPFNFIKEKIKKIFKSAT